MVVEGCSGLKKVTEGKGREGKGREGKGRDGKRREAKGMAEKGTSILALTFGESRFAKRKY